MRNKGVITIETIGERLKTIRKSKGLTLKDVQKDTNVSISSLSDFENDKNAPSAAAIISLSRKYNVSIDWLLTGEDVSPNNTVHADLKPEKTYSQLQGNGNRIDVADDDGSEAYETNSTPDLDQIEEVILKEYGAEYKQLIDIYQMIPKDLRITALKLMIQLIPDEETATKESNEKGLKRGISTSCLDSTNITA